MKKINVLDLLCDDLIEQVQEEKENLYSCVDENMVDKNVKLYIVPFLESHHHLLDLDFNFDINSKDDITKYKSMALLSATIGGFRDLTGTMPTYYKEYEKEYGTQGAYNELCLRVLIGNILDIKKGLKNIDENMTKTFKEFLDDLKNIIDNA